MQIISKITMILSVMLLLTACNMTDEKTDGNDESKRQYEIEYVTEKGQHIMECVVNNDKEGVKKVFSKHVAEICNLDKEIDDLFMFFDGKIISYGEPKEYGGGYILRDGEYVEKEVGGRVNNIKTDTGGNYYLFFSSYQVYKKNKDYEGVEYILIVDEADKENKTKLYIGAIE